MLGSLRNKSSKFHLSCKVANEQEANESQAPEIHKRLCLVYVVYIACSSLVYMFTVYVHMIELCECLHMYNLSVSINII